MTDDSSGHATPLARAIAGSLLGTAIGDAIALPYEGLSRRRVQKFWPAGPLRHRLLADHGFCSDDTEHACMVAQSLLAAGSDDDAGRFVAAFRSGFAWRLRWWFCGLPAGIGMATLRAIIKLWFNPFASGQGVFSAGNAPAMRSAIIGVCLGTRPELMRQIVSASTLLTHTDPRAEHGALAVALAAAIAAERREVPASSIFPDAFDAAIGNAVGAAGNELSAAIRRACESALRGESTEQFAASIGCVEGVTGYVMHTVPVALHAWFRHEGNYAAAIEAVVRCGGDTDTVAAIVGGIVGAGVGPEGIPEDWRNGVAEWPRSCRWIDALAARLAVRFSTGAVQRPLPLNLPMLLLRNAAFMIVVLGHGFRRLLPPY